MANRSYLYSCDREPGGKTFYARGLSEYGWAIPLAHKLLMTKAPRVTKSAIWNFDIGIVAERDGVFEKAIAFFDKLGEGTLKKRAEFDSELAEMKAFFAKAPPSKYVLLETGEILDLYGTPLEQEARSLCAELAKLGPKVDRAIAGKEAKWLAALRKKWEEDARPGYWSDILYFSFKTPPKKKAKPKAKKATKKATKKAKR